MNRPGLRIVARGLRKSGRQPRRTPFARMDSSAPIPRAPAGIASRSDCRFASALSQSGATIIFNGFGGSLFSDVNERKVPDRSPPLIGRPPTTSASFRSTSRAGWDASYTAGRTIQRPRSAP